MNSYPHFVSKHLMTNKRVNSQSVRSSVRVYLMVALEQKSRDHQTHSGSSSGDHKRLNVMANNLIAVELFHFALEFYVLFELEFVL